LSENRRGDFLTHTVGLLCACRVLFAVPFCVTSVRMWPVY